MVDHRHDLVGRGHAERLVPMIGELGLGGSGDGGRADAVMVDCGPGSFTGLRVGIAAARGLGIGWGAPVSGYSSTALIAALARAAGHGPAIAVVLEGGHGEVFVQEFDGLEAAGPLASLTPELARVRVAGRTAVGTGVRWLGEGVELLPDARGARLLPAALTALPPAPIYGRAPDARPMAGSGGVAG